jgi:hypothetical protein
MILELHQRGLSITAIAPLTGYEPEKGVISMQSDLPKRTYHIDIVNIFYFRFVNESA